MMLPVSSDLQGAARYLVLGAAASVAIICPWDMSKGVQFSIQDTACITQQQNKRCSLSLHIKDERFKNAYIFSENVFPEND